MVALDTLIYYLLEDILRQVIALLTFWEAYQFVANDPDRLWTALQQHLLLVSVPMAIGLAIALAQAEEQDILYGAVTIGNVWNFAMLDARKGEIWQDITLYRVPDDLEELTSSLIGIMGNG